jgi:AAA domain
MSNPAAPSRPLHLQTIDSLFAELIGGADISVGDDGAVFKLDNADSRAILNWYRVNRAKWVGNVMTADVEAIVTSLQTAVPTLTVPEIATPGAAKRLRLAKLVAHRFGGIHAYGTVDAPPADFVFEPREPITLFDGWNGAGKTSLINAIIWCLTGEILRPQRPPESGQDEFDGYFVRLTGESEEITSHALTPITPLPNPDHYLPAASKPVAIDSWVELTFADEFGNSLPPVRRTQLRTAKGKITETQSGFASLGVDPIAFKIGTTMPALLPFLRVGATSDLGLAAAKLTGLAEVSSLAKHATKTRAKLQGELKKERDKEIDDADIRFVEARSDLQKLIDEYPSMVPPEPLPVPSTSPELEKKLEALELHFNNLKAEALKEAQTILGLEFDPANKEARDNLESSIGPAQGQLKALSQLTSARRLKALTEISIPEWKSIDDLIVQMRSEADALAELAITPELGRRKQLYARVSAWIADFEGHDFSSCGICSRSLEGVLDPVTKRKVSEHLAEVTEADQILLSLTHKTWAAKWTGTFASQVPLALRPELGRDLPALPRDLMRSTLVDELFDTDAFKTTLSPLKAGFGRLCDLEFAHLPAFEEPVVKELPKALAAVAVPLMTTIRRLARARAFSDWRTANDDGVTTITKKILRGTDEGGEKIGDLSPIIRKLGQLDSIVKGVAPLNTSLDMCQRMVAQLKIRRAKEARLKLYDRAGSALSSVIELGSLAEKQVEGLRKLLHGRASYWRDRCYSNAYATAGHALRDTAMDVKGVLDIRVGSEKANAPAQHISNASALRASLMGFFLAFWEHVLTTRGGIALLVLDDPQELLDDDNTERLARLLPELVKKNAQIIVATYDRHFARAAVAAAREHASVEHRSVHPVNPSRSVLETAPAVEELDRKRDAYERDKDNAAIAQDYAGEVRIFLEARLADLFDDPAYPAYSTGTKPPMFSDHLNRLRGLVKTPPNALFRSKAITDFCGCAALAQGSACIVVLNTAHHNKASLSAGQVYAVAADLDLLRKSAERMHSEFRHWRWREPLQDTNAQSNVVQFKAMSPPKFTTLIHPDLAAFTAISAHSATQDAGSELLTSAWFADKTLFYVRTDNLGFAIPSGCIAIVESVPYEGKDHNLVIARQKDNILARRLFRKGEGVALAAEAPDPRQSKPTLMFDIGDLIIHRIVGMLTEQPPPPTQSQTAKGEATEIAAVASLSHIKTAYRVKEESGIPLALPGQVVLGGEEVLATQLSALEGELVALTLVDGDSVFKRVGSLVPGTEGRLRQFESIGGLGKSLVIAIGEIEGQPDVPVFSSARRVLGVLYTA